MVSSNRIDGLLIDDLPLEIGMHAQADVDGEGFPAVLGCILLSAALFEPPMRAKNFGWLQLDKIPKEVCSTKMSYQPHQFGGVNPQPSAWNQA